MCSVPTWTDIIKLTDDISIKMKYPNVKQFAQFESDDKPTEKMFGLIIGIGVLLAFFLSILFLPILFYYFPYLNLHLLMEFQVFLDQYH